MDERAFKVLMSKLGFKTLKAPPYAPKGFPDFIVYNDYKLWLCEVKATDRDKRLWCSNFSKEQYHFLNNHPKAFIAYKRKSKWSFYQIKGGILVYFSLQD